ncbi:uncharacterized protein DSM5745_02035 [Aspergillus mulundensis]|uniref:Uncharacterized protein n=1 Tax=Aspergillus mulundensis TaxID=1810919 RepID=A0A3D8SVE1_9EURO|nr:hypothetical protein DSM5745_02035 [Aspergillus mulundensis]RDW90260.1 hypothetical protein DSM5745_02035 [Aspergillus mulundensis]
MQVIASSISSNSSYAQVQDLEPDLETGLYDPPISQPSNPNPLSHETSPANESLPEQPTPPTTPNIEQLSLASPEPEARPVRPRIFVPGLRRSLPSKENMLTVSMCIARLLAVIFGLIAVATLCGILVGPVVVLVSLVVQWAWRLMGVPVSPDSGAGGS